MSDAAVGAIAFVTLLTIMVGARGIRVARTPDDFMVAARQVRPALNAGAITTRFGKSHAPIRTGSINVIMRGNSGPFRALASTGALFPPFLFTLLKNFYCASLPNS